MEIAEALDYIRQNHRGVLLTYRSSGGPQLSPIAAGVGSNGRIEISSRETAYKVKNLRRDPRASVCMFPDGWYGKWIQVDGTAEILSLPDAMEPLVEYYRGIAGEHPDWDEYREAMRQEQRLLIQITPTRAGPDRSG